MMNNTDKGTGKIINEDDGAPAPEQSFPSQGGELFPPPGVPHVALFQSLQPLPQTQHVPNVGSFATEIPLSCVALHAPDPEDNILDNHYKQNSPVTQVFSVSDQMMNNTGKGKGKMINEDDGAPAPEQSFPGQGCELFPSSPGVPHVALFQSLQPLPQAQHVPNVGSSATEVPLSCVAPDPEVYAKMEQYAFETAVKELDEKRNEVECMTGYVEELRKLVDDDKAEGVALERQAKYYEHITLSLSDKIKSLKEASGIVEEAEPPFYVAGNEKLDCKVCGRKVARVMLLPCTHLCVCVSCDRALEMCPMCGEKKERSVEVYFPNPPPGHHY